MGVTPQEKCGVRLFSPTFFKKAEKAFFEKEFRYNPSRKKHP
jgi:hypothetical protein